MTGLGDIAALIVAAELQFERCGSELARIDREAAALRAEAEQVRAHRPDPEMRLTMRGSAAAAMAGFEIWRDLRLRDLGRRLAELAAAHDAQRRATRRAFGRLEAIRHLAQDARGR